MSEFEFVQVTVAIILGLGITELLRNLGGQIRRRAEIQLSKLQIAASCLLVIVILRYLWTSWSTLQVSWTLPLFFLNLTPAIALALAAQVIVVDWDSSTSPEDQYLRNRKGTYLFWALAPSSQILFDLILANDLGPFIIGRVAVIGLLVSLAFNRNPTYHWAILSILFISVLIGLPLTQFTLS